MISEETTNNIASLINSLSASQFKSPVKQYCPNKNRRVLTPQKISATSVIFFETGSQQRIEGSVRSEDEIIKIDGAVCLVMRRCRLQDARKIAARFYGVRVLDIREYIQCPTVSQLVVF